jgi:hypothetical protein
MADSAVHCSLLSTSERAPGLTANQYIDGWRYGNSMAAAPRTFTGIHPRVNEAKEFIEIAKDFKSGLELLREALSNSWDANASNTEISIDTALLPSTGRGRRKIRLNVTVQDNGDGMDEKELAYFFNLGDSHKPAGSIGTKGHGTKIYYKSSGIHVRTHRNGTTLEAETEVPPWDSLQSGVVPTYKYTISENRSHERGTTVNVQAFDSPPAEFSDVKSVAQYLQWNTICGWIKPVFYPGGARMMNVRIRLPDGSPPATYETRFFIPPQNTDLKVGTSKILKCFPPKIGVDCGETPTGERILVDYMAVLLGDQSRDFIPDSYNQTGLWYCKDYIMIERDNSLISEVSSGEYYYRSFLIFANCQQLDLTANRNEVRHDESFELALEGIRTLFAETWKDHFVQDFFKLKSLEEKTDKKARMEREMAERVSKYGKRPTLKASQTVPGLIKKVPRNEAETVLVLQALLSGSGKNLDFQIGEYNATQGTDAIIEYEDKGIRQTGWMEVVLSLDRLFAWTHDVDRIHKIVCWELGELKPEYKLPDGRVAKYEKVGSKHILHVDGETIPVYVLSEIVGYSP